MHANEKAYTCTHKEFGLLKKKKREKWRGGGLSDYNDDQILRTEMLKVKQDLEIINNENAKRAQVRSRI